MESRAYVCELYPNYLEGRKILVLLPKQERKKDEKGFLKFNELKQEDYSFLVRILNQIEIDFLKMGLRRIREVQSPNEYPTEKIDKLISEGYVII